MWKRGRDALSMAVILALVPVLAIGATLAGDGEASAKKRALGELSIEDLMEVEFTSASKRAEKLSDAKAAAFVITQADLRRSGVRNIPEALRMVPGIQVARVGSSRWAITARGFNGVFANKLLVLMDGRSVYDPLYSGVFWDVQDTAMDDIDRIEVIRGPGAALWGANAVSGVINIITKDASETEGTLVDVAVGNETPVDATVRYAGSGGNLAYRAYVRYIDRDEAVDAMGNGTADDWSLVRTGARVDWRPNDRDHVMGSADLHDGELKDQIREPIFVPPYLSVSATEDSISGGHLMGRWSRSMGEESSLELQAYYSRTERDVFGGGFEHDTFDLDFQHGFSVGQRHALLWGVGLRTVSDELRDSPVFTVDPTSDSYDLFSAFLQDDIRVSDAFEVTVGAKVERNDFSGTEFQPNVRGLWRPAKRHSVWASVAKAVRTPFRVQTGVTIQVAPVPPTPLNPIPGVFRLTPVSELPAEELVAYEIGYRVLASAVLSLDVASFYNDYDDLHVNPLGTPFLELVPPPLHLVVPVTWSAAGGGHTFGVEVEAGWQAVDSWRLQLAASVLQMEIETDDPTTESFVADVNTTSPSWQASIRSQWDVTEDVELDVWLRHVDELPADAIDSYTELDVRLGWQMRPNLELMLGGRNLLDDQHAEFEQEDFTTGEIERSFYGRAVFRF